MDMINSSAFSVSCPVYNSSLEFDGTSCCMIRMRESMNLNFSIQSDVYSFGVFLVELVSGRNAVSDQNIIQWVSFPTLPQFLCQWRHFTLLLSIIPALKYRPAHFVPRYAGAELPGIK